MIRQQMLVNVVAWVRSVLCDGLPQSVKVLAGLIKTCCVQ